MDNYIVSARKYRPTTFETVVGQSALTQTLRNAISTGHLAHAYLFCGPRGVGKTTCARIFAKTINCLNPTPEHDACNECESCVAFNEQRSFNIHELDAASNNSVEDIRSLIEQVRIPPQIGKYSVYIIDEVHMLSQGAFNALLKTLEEPPSYAVFILATTEKHKVLPTILSRCQVYDFTRITIADIIGHLQYVAGLEGVSISEEALNVVAQKADGGMRDALSIFDQLVSFCGTDISYDRTIEVLNVLDTDYYFRLVDAALDNRQTDLLLIFDEILQKGFDAGHFISGFAQHVRDVLVSKDAATAALLETSQTIRQRYVDQAARCSAKWLFQALDTLNTCDIQYRTAKNRRLTVELALLKIGNLTAPVATDEPKGNPIPPTAQAPKPTVTSAVSDTHMPAVMTPPTATPTAVSTAAPTATRPQTAPKMPPSFMTIPTLDALGKNKQTASSDSAPAPIEQADNNMQDNPFTADQLVDAWVGLSKQFSGEERLQAILDSTVPQLVNPHLCRITVTNPGQKKEFAKWGKTVMDIVRGRLSNDHLMLEVTVEEYQQTAMAYTSNEKYKVMVAENPHLKDLKDKLNLQLE